VRQPFRRQQRSDVDIGVDVVGEAVQEHHGWAVRGSRLIVGDVENAGIDVPERLQPLRRGCTRSM